MTHAECAARCLHAIKDTGAAFVCPTLKQFGDGEKTFGESPFDPQGLVGGNYIDATGADLLAREPRQFREAAPKAH